MALGTFKGGIHPYDGKELSKDRPIESLVVESEYVFPLGQHIGTPAVPVVEPGERVLVGQKIAESKGVISADVVSSVSGKVLSIENRTTTLGDKMESIIIEDDGVYEAVEGLGQTRDYSSMSKEEILTCMKQAGIIGMGGAGFPTHVKLNQKDPSKIDYVIINGVECEPYLTGDYRLMLERGQQIVEGLKIELMLFEKAKGVIGIEDNKPDIIEVFKDLVKDEPRIEVAALKTKYPQGGERTLIYAVSGRKINHSMLPADVGCMVSNVATAAAIYEAVALQTPLIKRIITVTGRAIKEPKNYEVRIGCSCRSIVEAAGGFVSEPFDLISGGPLMGKAMPSLDVPVLKTTSSILALNEEEAQDYESSNCIRCGRCAAVCPSRVLPMKLVKCTDRNDYQGFEEQNGLECCECGCCSYVCPARIKLTPSFAKARKVIQLKKNRMKNKKKN